MLGIFEKTFLESYLDFCFVICISPFRLKRCAHNVLKVNQFCPQKIIAVLIALMDIFGSITKIRANLSPNLDNPVGYFNLMWAIAACLMHYFFYYTLWTKQHHISEAVRIYTKSFQVKRNLNRSGIFHSMQGIIALALCAMSLFLALLPAIKGSYILPHPSSLCWTPSTLFKAHVQQAQFMFFHHEDENYPGPMTLVETFNSTKNHFNETLSMNFNSTGECQSQEFGPFSWEEIVKGVAHICIYTGRYLGSYFLDLFMILSALTMWLAVKTFTDRVMRSSKDGRDAKMISLLEMRTDTVTGSQTECDLELYDARMRKGSLEKYEDLKALNEAINCAMSPILFCYVFEAIFYYATNLNTIFTASGWHARLQVAHFLFGCSAVFGFSADVTRKMDSFRLWLVNGQAGKSVSSERLLALIHETQSKAIGISAYGIFTIDYPLIFNIVTTTVTFFLIVVQFVPVKCG